jgi:hypothetical protein
MTHIINLTFGIYVWLCPLATGTCILRATFQYMMVNACAIKFKIIRWRKSFAADKHFYLTLKCLLGPIDPETCFMPIIRSVSIREYLNMASYLESLYIKHRSIYQFSWHFSCDNFVFVMPIVESMKIWNLELDNIEKKVENSLKAFLFFCRLQFTNINQ